MKNFVWILLVLFLGVSCKKQLVKEPKRLIEKEKMVDIMCDLSLLEALRYQNPASIDSMDADPTKFVFKKYKVDSLQFSQSNKYYAADYETYKEIFDSINVRIEKQKKIADSLIKIEEKKAAKKNKKSKKVDEKGLKKPEGLKSADSLKQKKEDR